MMLDSLAFAGMIDEDASLSRAIQMPSLQRIPFLGPMVEAGYPAMEFGGWDYEQVGKDLQPGLGFQASWKIST